MTSLTPLLWLLGQVLLYAPSVGFFFCNKLTGELSTNFDTGYFSSERAYLLEDMLAELFTIYDPDLTVL